MLIDTHAHLEYPEFDSDRDAMMKRASDAGVTSWINITDGLVSFNHAYAIVQKYPQAYLSLGVHPHAAGEATRELFDDLAAKVGDPKIVALGETGLDYFSDFAPREKQKEVFTQFLQLSKESDLPLIFHQREAENDFLQVIDRHFPSGLRGVMHCFTGSLNFARECLRRGLYISISGIVTFKKAQRLCEVVRQIPLDRLVIETDSPYLAPEPYRGKRNELAYLVKTAEKIAALRSMSLEEIAKITVANTKKLFSLP